MNSAGKCRQKKLAQMAARNANLAIYEWGQPRTALDGTYCLELCVRLIRYQPNGFHSKINFGSTVSAAKRAMNIAAPVNTPK